jgi:arylsulfatase
MNRPNILWICTDQQRFDTLGCYGNDWVRTPRIDALAAGGVLFERAFCQNPLCTPSRASFLTGRYPRTTRARQNGQSIPDDEVLVTKLLADSGYDCGLAGKLHLSACAPAACPDRERRIDDGYDVFRWSHHPDADWPTADYNLWLRDRGAEYSRRPFPGSPHVQTSVPAELHQTTWCVEEAIKFVEERAGAGSPWLFSLNCFDPHHPFDPPEEYLRPYLDRIDAIPLPRYVPGELEEKPKFQKVDHQGAYGGQFGFYPYSQMSDLDHRLIRAAYWAMCDLIDDQVGRLLDALDRTGQREDTLVVFMSDHGEMLGDHGFYLKGPYFYEPAIRVPLIASWPGKIAPGRARALVELVDLAPTLVELAGLPPYAGMQGRSLLPLLTGRAARDRHRDDVYCEHYGTIHRQPGQEPAHATMIRTGRYKMAAVHGSDAGELYDLREDPAEVHNLWRDPALQGVKLDLYRRLCDRMAFTVDPLPIREANY